MVPGAPEVCMEVLQRLSDPNQILILVMTLVRFGRVLLSATTLLVATLLVATLLVATLLVALPVVLLPVRGSVTRLLIVLLPIGIALSARKINTTIKTRDRKINRGGEHSENLIKNSSQVTID